MSIVTRVAVPVVFTLLAAGCSPAAEGEGSPAAGGGGFHAGAGGAAGSQSQSGGGAKPTAGGNGGGPGTGDPAGAGGTGGSTVATGGTGGGGGGGGMGGMGGTDNPTGDIWGGLKNPPRKSAGCGKATTITSGAKTIMSGGMERRYVIDIPANYDPATPYRLFFVGHGIPAPNGAQDVAGGLGWWGLKAPATAANVPAIWVAPQGVGGTWSTQNDREHVLFDDITAFVKDGLCVDTTRIFAAGMSGGGMLTYSLSTSRQKVIRAGFAMSPTNFNTYVPQTKLTDPIAWMQTTGMGDTLTAWIGNEAQKTGAKFIALEKAADNGCTIPATLPTWTSGNHVCYDFAGCKPGHPVKACTFNGGHVHFNSDPGGQNWIAKEGWEFLMQF